MTNEKIESSFRFDHYDVEEISYHRNLDANFSKNVKTQFNLKMDTEIKADMAEAKLKFDIDINPVNEEGDAPFTLKLIVSGYFSTDEDFPKEKIKKFCEVNGAAALFPFIRAIVADITRTANIPVLVFPLLNIVNLQKSMDQND